MYRIICLIFLICLFSATLLADIPPPPIGEQIRIELTQNYPEYQFYLASFKLKVVPNPNPPHPSRPDMIVDVPDSFKLRKIDLTYEKPLTEAITAARIQYRGTIPGESLYLVAVRKSLGDVVETKIREAIENHENGTGIYAAYLWQSLESAKDERRGAKLIVNRVSKFDDEGLKIGVSEGTVSAYTGKAGNCIGLGLILTGIAFTGIWWSRKRLV